MYCNKPYINTGAAFNNGQVFGFNNFNPSPHNGIYPDSIVGDGVVNHAVLPDGTCQYFFTPANWWPLNPHCNINPTQNNPHLPWSSNIPTWFVRSISIPTQPSFWSHSPFQRNETPRPLHCSEYNMNIIPNGYQLKFHDDRWTSTTDLHYFCPRIRQIEHTFAFPSRGCAAVQVNTPATTNTVCSYEVVNSKPCSCAATRRFVDTPVSAMSIDIEKPTASDCKPSCSYKSKCKKDSSDKSNSRQLQLLPRDVRKKRVKFDKKTKNVIKNNICECSRPLLIQSKSKESNVSSATDKKQSKDVSCECWPPVSVAHSTATANNLECKTCQIDKNESKVMDTSECQSPLATKNVSCPSSADKNCVTTEHPISKDVSCECSPWVPEGVKLESKEIDCQTDKNESKSDDVCECDPSLTTKSNSKDICLSSYVKDSIENKNSDNVSCNCRPTAPETKPDHVESKGSDCQIDKDAKLGLGSFVDECLKQIELWYPKADESKNYFQCCKKPSEACCSRQYKGK